MIDLYRWVGRLGAIGGVLLGLFAVVARLTGSYIIGGFQMGTLILAATFLMAMAATAYLACLVEGQRR